MGTTLSTIAPPVAPPPNLPGVQVEGVKYRDHMVLYTAMDRVECVVDGAPPGPRGRLFIVETDKAVRVPWEAGRFILEHLGYTGVVRVAETETDTGITYDIAGAREESLVKGEEEDKKRIAMYIQYCVTDKIENKRPVPAPPESIMRILKRRNVDLRTYGIVPLGFEQPADEASRKIQEERDDLRNQVAILTRQVAMLLKDRDADVEGEEGAEQAEQTGQEPEPDTAQDAAPARPAAARRGRGSK